MNKHIARIFYITLLASSVVPGMERPHQALTQSQSHMSSPLYDAQRFDEASLRLQQCADETAQYNQGSSKILGALSDLCKESSRIANSCPPSIASSTNNQEINRENACSQTLTRNATQSCPQLSRDAAGTNKEDAIRQKVQTVNAHRAKAKKWFFISLAGFSATFLSWKYNWLPEKATYGCAGLSGLFGYASVKWAYRSFKEFRQLSELRKK